MLFGMLRAISTRQWMMIASGVAFGLVGLTGLLAPHGERVGVALRATARWSFFWFWLASTGAALRALFGSTFQHLAERGRDFGLAFAAAHLAHIGVAVFLVYVLAAPFPVWKQVFFGVGAFWVYLLALLSIKRVSVVLAPNVWRIVRRVGIEYITLVFLVDFFPRLMEGGAVNIILYGSLVVLAAGGPLLRIAAQFKSPGVVRPADA